MNATVKNRELFVRDPAGTPLMNDGQARIDEGQSEKERSTLREELSHFVCEGQYSSGMLRILESYLKNLGGTSQAAAWVSGFYGSGKSHLLKMLRHLWVNTEFPEDGSTARGLVPELPDDIRAVLRELDVQGRRLGGLRAAAGTLPAGGGSAVRLAVLGIILRSLGLPESFPQAKFCLYLKRNGFLEPVRQALETAGKDFHRELNNLYVSPVLHDALMACDRGFEDRKAVRALLKAQFPRRDDISTDEFIQTIREVLAVGGQLPCTVVVLDEVQLFIADSSERATQVVEVAEALTKQLDSRVLLVGAGQTALSSTPQLQKLRDRFTIPVELSDADVESVIRRVLLAKRPDQVDILRSALESHAGEIDRQLAGTAIGPRREDRDVLVDDYPLLRVRRRFWEHVFRAVDVAGTHSQVRTQLRIVYEALRRLAESPLGTVVPADFMFEQLQSGLLQQGVLLREISETIQRLDDGSPEGRLAARLCGLVFLIRKLPRDPGIDIGVRATPETLADLLVSDLGDDGRALRKRVPKLLDSLAEDGVLLNVDGEYNLQTRESAEWDKEFRNRQTRLVSSEPEVHSKRDALLRDAVAKALGGLRVAHGESKEARRILLHFGDDPPEPSSRDVPVWVRDGWCASEREVLAAARSAGPASPVIFVHLPKGSADDLRNRIVEGEAARQTLDFKGAPSTDGGKEARGAMKTRLEAAERSRDEIIRGIVEAAKVYKGGGTELFNLAFDEKVKEAASDALDRLFPRFHEADHKSWRVVIQRARGGSDTPLEVVGWTDAVEKNPVAREILRAVGSGKDGKSIRRAFSESPFGWPQDAIDGALIALHAGGHLRARRKGTPLAPGQLDQGKVSASDFQRETVALAAKEKIALRWLFQEAEILARPSDDLSEKAGDYLRKLASLAQEAGGDPPLPERPSATHIDELRGLAGNEQLARILARKDRLCEEAPRWKSASELSEKRRPAWSRLERLLGHGAGLPELNDLSAQADAILEGRLLLEAADPVGPVLKAAASRLRSAVIEAAERCRAIDARERAALESSDAWRKITEEQRREIVTSEGLDPIELPKLGSDGELERALEATSLASWGEKADALGERYRKAALAAARLLRPKLQSVRLTSRTLETAEEVKRWIKETQRDLLERIEAGPVVIG